MESWWRRKSWSCESGGRAVGGRVDDDARGSADASRVASRGERFVECRMYATPMSACVCLSV